MLTISKTATSRMVFSVIGASVLAGVAHAQDMNTNSASFNAGYGRVAGRENVHNSQTNNGDAATATTSISTSARSVRGVSTAVGDSASFYVTQPGN